MQHCGLWEEEHKVNKLLETIISIGFGSKMSTNVKRVGKHWDQTHYPRLLAFPWDQGAREICLALLYTQVKKSKGPNFPAVTGLSVAKWNKVNQYMYLYWFTLFHFAILELSTYAVTYFWWILKLVKAFSIAPRLYYFLLTHIFYGVKSKIVT